MDSQEEAIAVKVRAVMTAPRFECTWARNIIEHSLRTLNIPLAVSGGVFYGQCMQKMFAECIDVGVELIITIDFDSVFTPEDLTRLIKVAMSDPGMDALAAWQCRRGNGSPLLSCGIDGEIEVSGPLKVNTAHFGLTAIKTAALAGLPKPWFWSKPDSNGEWTDDKVDDDIHFWNIWKEHGKTVYVDPFVQIGHLEEVVSHYTNTDGKLEHKFSYPKDWYNNRMRPGE
jgi:hypothetical protein